MPGNWEGVVFIMIRSCFVLQVRTTLNVESHTVSVSSRSIRLVILRPPQCLYFSLM